MLLVMRVWAVFVVAAKRLLAQPGVALATAVGLVISVALALSIPLYADAVYYRVLRQEIRGTLNVDDSSDLPLILVFRFTGGWNTSLEWEAVKPVGDFLSQQAARILQLPSRQFVRHFRTNNFGFYSVQDAVDDATGDPMAWVSFGTADGLDEYVTVIEGAMPTVASMEPDSPVEVLVSEKLAATLGLQVGGDFIGLVPSPERQSTRNVEVPIRVAGIWRANESTEHYWFTDPNTLSDVLFVPEMTFEGRLAETLDHEVYVGLWFLVMDGSDVHAGDVGAVEHSILTLQRQVATILPGTRLGISPMAGLRGYWQAFRLLTIRLYAFSIPIVGLMLTFVGLMVGLAVERQRNEIAVLRSRGAMPAQVVGVAALEGVILAVVSLAVGVPIGEGIAHLIGRARSFLDFSMHSSLRVGTTATTLYFGMGLTGLTLLAQILPTVSATRHTVVTYKQERARSLRPPWWQRLWLDVLLLIPTFYGGYLLRQQGSIVISGLDSKLTYDPFANPLLFLVPSLAVYAVTLLVLRMVPLVMGLFARIAARLKSVSFLLAARHLSRTPNPYSAPLVLLVMTLSLSLFVATLAETLEIHLYDQSYYEAGADMQLVERGRETTAEVSASPFPESSEEVDQGLRWRFLPVSEHLKVPGVEAAARVGRYSAYAALAGAQEKGSFIGIDRVDFPKVAFWREDFSPVSLGALMNGLASAPNAVLVPTDVLAAHYLNIGDTIHLVVDTFGRRVGIDFEVVGVFDLFPTWYPTDEEKGPLFVGNLDYIFQEAGGQYPYNVWLRTDPSVTYEEIAEGVRNLGLDVVTWRGARQTIIREQQRPQRQGLFGVLSVGFVAAGLLTVLGFTMYAFFSFRRRTIELGVLRAIGLSTRQMMLFLGWELMLLVLVGIGAGTGLGVWISKLFIPYLQVGSEPAARIPPFVVQIPWPSVFHFYILFGALFFGALSILTMLLLRMRIFEAIKLGETT